MENTVNYNLIKPDLNEDYNVSNYNRNMDTIDTEINRIYRVNEIIDPKQNKIYNVFVDTDIDNINGRPICKENTNTPVTIKANKVSTLYYNGSVFFYRASASGDAIAENVLANKKFSNENDIDIIGTMSNNGDWSVTPTKEDIIIPRGYHSGGGENFRRY